MNSSIFEHFKGIGAQDKRIVTHPMPRYHVEAWTKNVALKQGEVVSQEFLDDCYGAYLSAFY